MRWLFVLLLLFNVLYLGWEMDQEARLKVPEPEPGLSIPGTAKRLSLLSEMAIMPAARETEDMIEVTGSLQQQNEGDEQLVTPDQLVADMPDMHLGNLGANTTESCFTFGPLVEARQAQGLTDWFRSRSIWTQTRHSDKKGRRLFWVYLAPSESRESAMAMLQDLHERGVRDYRLIDRGSLENAVSLGLYSSQSAVNKRLSELKQKGYKPIVVPYTNADQIYWLDIRLASGSDIIEKMYSDYPGQFKSIPVRCETIAISGSEQ